MVRSYVQHLNAKDKGDNIILKFFDYLLKNSKRNPNVHQCSQFLYGKSSDARFRMIKKKLRAKILDALLVEKNIELNESFDEMEVWTQKLRKKVLTLNYIFHSKGSLPITNELIEEILSNGKKYENFGVMADALKFKKYIKGFSKGINEFNEINEKITFYEYCEQAKSRANDHYYKLIVRHDLQSSASKNEKKKLFQEAILELKKDLKYTESGVVAYYLKTIEVAYFHETYDYLAARDSCLDLLKIIREYPSVYKNIRVGITFDYLGECDVFLGDYEKAISNFRAAQKIFTDHSKNYLVSKELELKTLIYADEIPSAEKALKEIVGHKDVAVMGDFARADMPIIKQTYFSKRRTIKRH